MKHGSLFSGIGGFDLAAEWMGWENVFHCEWNKFGQQVLKHYWPQSKSYDDIKKTDFTIHRGQIDILTGGFPCQPYSAAGKRLGKEDDRHLWPEMLRAIREIQPRYVVGENVRGLTNWNGGMVFDEVQADLEAEGYEVLPFLLPACAVNAPHRRDRIWFVAYATGNGGNRTPDETSGKAQGQNRESAEQFKQCSKVWVTPDTNGNGRRGSENGQYTTKNGEHAQCGIGQCNGDGIAADTCDQGPQRGKINGGLSSCKPNRNEQLAGSLPSTWQNFPTVSPIRLRDDGVSDKLLRFVVKEIYDTDSYTSEENRIENLPKVWEQIQQKEVWKQIRGLYSLEKPQVLFQTMQLYSGERTEQGKLSPFGEELCKPILQHLRKHKEFRRSPQGRELEEQRAKQFGNTLSFLPHEVALAARRFEAAISKFEAWHRNESIKAGGNAIVPQVAYEIFKSIEQSCKTNLNI